MVDLVNIGAKLDEWRKGSWNYHRRAVRYIIVTNKIVLRVNDSSQSVSKSVHQLSENFIKSESHLDCDLPVASNINLSFKPSFNSGIPGDVVGER